MTYFNLPDPSLAAAIQNFKKIFYHGNSKEESEKIFLATRVRHRLVAVWSNNNKYLRKYI